MSMTITQIVRKAIGAGIISGQEADEAMNASPFGPLPPDPEVVLRDWIACIARQEDWGRYVPTAQFEERVLDAGEGRKRIAHVQKFRSQEEARYAYADAMLKARAVK